MDTAPTSKGHTTEKQPKPASRTELDELTDGELLEAFRSGNNDAYGALFRRHIEAAIRVAQKRTPDYHLAIEAAHEACSTILAAIKSGAGPTGTFTGYLFASINREVARQHRLRRYEKLVGEYEALPNLFVPDFTDQLPDPAIRAAFTTLPVRWQRAIWYLDINEIPPREAAPLFGLTPNALAALHRRAKKGFRRAFTQQQITVTNTVQTLTSRHPAKTKATIRKPSITQSSSLEPS
jgi:DNA-directed RNA polymerase specialized sigma24 family protein